MPKSRHKKRKHQNKPLSLLFNPSKELKQIDAMIEAGDLPEAVQKLKELAHRLPNRVEVFETMLMLAVELEDKETILQAAIRLAELQSHVPAHHFNLFGAYMQNMMPALALKTGRYFLSRWPDDWELGQDIKKEVEQLAELLQKEALKLQLPQDGWLEPMVLHEKVQVALSQNKYEETRRLATQLIAIMPHFPSPYNNRSLASWILGDAEAAIADARRVLEFDSGNVHALSNLTRFLRLSNRLPEAREIAERLKAAASPSLDGWTKKAEALSYLFDDAGVLQVAEQADKAGALFGKHADPFLLHLAGVAAARLGEEKRARKFWKEAANIAPSFGRVQANLDDFDKPPGERDGAWPFELNDWLSPHLFEEFVKTVGRSVDSKNMKNLKGAAQRYVEKHPHVLALAPALLERGDPVGREFALRLAQMVETPEAIAMIEDFLHSPYGPDMLRQSALQFLQESKIIESGAKLSFWSRGRQTEIIAMNWRIDGVPYEKPPAAAIAVAARGFEDMRRGQWERAQEYFSQARAMAPNSASIGFNLAVAEANQGNITKAIADLKALAERHPKYAFVHCQLALHALANDRIEEARERLKILFAFEHFHFDEFATFCQSQVLFFIIGDPNLEAAKHWLQMWEQFAPDDSKLDIIRPVVGDSLLARAAAKSLISWLRE
jgi:tetratricopeptide (TPR) repeat protein